MVDIMTACARKRIIAYANGWMTITGTDVSPDLGPKSIVPFSDPLSREFSRKESELMHIDRIARDAERQQRYAKGGKWV